MFSIQKNSVSIILLLTMMVYFATSSCWLQMQEEAETAIASRDEDGQADCMKWINESSRVELKQAKSRIAYLEGQPPFKEEANISFQAADPPDTSNSATASEGAWQQGYCEDSAEGHPFTTVVSQLNDILSEQKMNREIDDSFNAELKQAKTRITSLEGGASGTAVPQDWRALLTCIMVALLEVIVILLILYLREGYWNNKVKSKDEKISSLQSQLSRLHSLLAMTIRPESESEEHQRKEGARLFAAEELACPITVCLPRDPVMAEDGRFYERSAINEYIRTQKRRGLPVRSLLTNQAMGTKLIPAPQIKNLIETLISGGVISGELADDWKGKGGSAKGG